MTATNPRRVTLFHAPQSRSGGVLALVEEIGADYELSVLDLRHGEQRKDSYLAVNPMGKVPAIVHDGALVTEQGAVYAYLADLYPETGIAPAIRPFQIRQSLPAIIAPNTSIAGPNWNRSRPVSASMAPAATIAGIRALAWSKAAAVMKDATARLSLRVWTEKATDSTQIPITAIPTMACRSEYRRPMTHAATTGAKLSAATIALGRIR